MLSSALTVLLDVEAVLEAVLDVDEAVPEVLVAPTVEAVLFEVVFFEPVVVAVAVAFGSNFCEPVNSTDVEPAVAFVVPA